MNASDYGESNARVCGSSVRTGSIQVGSSLSLEEFSPGDSQSGWLRPSGSPNMLDSHPTHHWTITSESLRIWLEATSAPAPH